MGCNLFRILPEWSATGIQYSYSYSTLSCIELLRYSPMTSSLPPTLIHMLQGNCSDKDESLLELRWNVVNTTSPNSTPPTSGGGAPSGTAGWTVSCQWGRSEALSWRVAAAIGADDPYQDLTRLEMMRMVGQKEEEIRQTVEESQRKDRVIQCSGELLQQMVAETGRKEQTIQQKEEEIQRMSEGNYSTAWSCVLCVCTCLHEWVHLCIHIAIISCLVGWPHLLWWCNMKLQLSAAARYAILSHSNT